MRTRGGPFAVGVAITLLAGCGSSPPAGSGALPSVGSTTPALAVQSPDLSGGTVSREVTCDGTGRAPSVAWTPSPHAVAAVVELLDPDAPGSTFVHWLAVADAVDAAAGVLHSPVVEGRNDFGRIGYWGPCPPGGQVHHYHLAVTTYATALTLSPGFTATDLAGAVGGHAALGHGEVVATYGR